MKKIKLLVIVSITLISNIGVLFANPNTDPIIDGWALPSVEVLGKRKVSKPQLTAPKVDVDAIIKEFTDKFQKKDCQWDCKCPEWTKKINDKCVSCAKEWVCCGIKLNTNVPFVGNCIETKVGAQTTQLNAFPRLIGGMMRLLMNIILVMSLLMIVAGGVLMTTGGREKSNYSKGMDMIKKVAYGMALLGASGVILKLINPNFFV